MKNSPTSWIVFYSRDGLDSSLKFIFEGHPTLADVVKKIRNLMHPKDYIDPPVEFAAGSEEEALCFLDANEFENLSVIPYIERRRSNGK